MEVNQNVLAPTGAVEEGIIPVVLFVYARPTHTRKALLALRENKVPLVIVYADGPKGDADSRLVNETRSLLRDIKWCDLRLLERRENLGLGRNILSGVTEVASAYSTFVVWEDDLICVAGTYSWLCAALRHFEHDPRVMSVTAWTHPRVTPSDISGSPYFDGRAECWVWGAYSRSWIGMDEPALLKLRKYVDDGGKADSFGSDLPIMAAEETAKNIWAVRWLFHHLQHNGLCVRPPWSMVEHEGFDRLATNAPLSEGWENPPLRPAPPVPSVWPAVRVNEKCASLWKRAYPKRWRAKLRRLFYRLSRVSQTEIEFTKK